MSVAIVAVTVVCFAQSYRQLFDWATRHRIPGWIAPTWPLMLDAFIIIGEIAWFVSIVKRWPVKTRILAVSMAVTGLVASVATQWLFLPGGLVSWDRATAVVAPLGATLGLAAGLTVVKWLTRDERNGRTAVAEAEHIARDAAPRTAPTAAPGTAVAVVEHEHNGRRGGLDDDAITRARDAITLSLSERGEPPSAYWLGMHYLGGDPSTGRRGNERVAKQLIDEARAEA